MKPAGVIGWAITTTSAGDLAERCATGDARAQKELVESHQRIVYHLALQLLRDPNDALGPATGISLPHLSPDTRAAAMLIQPLPPLVLKNLALAAVVTREGQLASVEILRRAPLHVTNDEGKAQLERALSRLVSNVRFFPARARGAPVAVNVVWLLERTTVAPPKPLTQVSGT